MGHVVLLGDSIFDNASYVPGEPPVIEHLRGCLPGGWEATLLAVDGDVVEGVAGQLDRLPAGATHLVISAGGNNALQQSAFIMREPAASYAEALAGLESIRLAFQAAYRRMLDDVRPLGRPIVVCTIYDAIPGLGPAERAGLCLFNDVIVREAARAGVPAVDLRLVCDEPGDYSAMSPIEPSSSGGEKVARAVARFVTSHESSAPGCRIHS